MAILEASTAVNGIQFHLIATRTYLPQYMQLGEEFESRAEFAVNYGEILYIMWTDVAAWRDAAYRYLTAPDDDDCFDIDFPVAGLDDWMLEHKKWFDDVLLSFGDSAYYDCEDDSKYMPVIINGDPYLIWGFPSALINNQVPSHSINLNWSLNEGSDLPILIDRQFVCIKSARHMSPSEDDYWGIRHARIQEALFKHPKCNPEVALSFDNSRFSIFIAPSSEYSINSMTRIELEPEDGFDSMIISGNNFAVSNQILERVANRDLQCYRSKLGDLVYTMEIRFDSAQDAEDIRLSVELVATPVWSSMNLILASIFVGNDAQGGTLYVELNARIISLVQSVGLKSLIEYLKHGLVLKKKEGFAAQLDKRPKWCEKLAATPPDVIKKFEKMGSSLFEWVMLGAINGM